MDVFAYLDGCRLPAHWSSDNLCGSRSLAHFREGLLFSREYHRYNQWHTEIHQHEKDLALFRLFQLSLTEIWRNRQPLQIRPVWHDVQLGWLLICRSLKMCLRLLEETNPTLSTKGNQHLHLRWNGVVSVRFRHNVVCNKSNDVVDCISPKTISTS